MDKDVVHLYNGILLGHKKNKIMVFAATWMDLEIIILSKTEKERQISYDICLSFSVLLSMIISRSIQVAANTIILFFL